MLKRALLIALIAAPIGCGKSAADVAEPRLVAKVNGTRISLQDARSASGAPAAQALEKVIERELLVQQALAARLDREPHVVELIENARREVLARAWLEHASAAAGASRDEVRAFYRENPALFAERRIYRLRELVVPAGAELVDALRAEAARAREVDEIAAWLRARGVKHSADAFTQPAEQLPLAYLPQLARMQPGEIAVFASPLGASVIQVVRVEEAPLAEAQAAPLIEKFLAARRRLEIAEAELKRLRAAATIEYLGEIRER